MRRGEKFLVLILLLALTARFVAPFQAQASETESGVSETDAETLTGIQVVDGEFCCFSEGGEIDEKRTDELRAAARTESDISPLVKLIGEPNEKEYFGQGCWFGTSGKESGEDGTWYYDNFMVYVYETKDITYYMGASAQTAEKTDFQSMLAAVVESEAGSVSDPEVRLKALFRYVEEEYSYTRKMGFEAYSGWQEDYAYEMLSEMSGSCYHYAALYGFLAKEAADCDVRICIGTTDGFSASSWQPHAWTEVKLDGKWYVFDTNLDKYGADSTLKYYKLSIDSDSYRKTYKVEESYEVSFEPETGTESEAETEIETEAEAESEVLTAAELQTETETEIETEIESESETEVETEAESETETEPETATEVEVNEEDECVLTLDNRTGLVFSEAHLTGDEMILVEKDGTEHTFSEVNKEHSCNP